jgi:iron complex transport system substrate-binding protein
MKLWAALIVVVVALACFYGGYRAGYGAASAVGPAPTITAPQNATILQAVVSRHEVKYPITIVDSAGRTVTIEKEPQRVVAISTAMYVLLSLGVGNKIVGVGGWIYQDPIYMNILQRQGAKNITNLGPWPPGVEGILSTNPDLVILYASFYRGKMDEIASKLPSSVKVVYFDCYLPTTMFDEWYKLGLIFNRVDEALELISKWSSRLTSIAAKSAEIKPSDRVKVYYEWPTKFQTAGIGSSSHQLITLAGGANVFGDVATPYPTVSSEAVIERNPDVIIKDLMSYFNPILANSTRPLEDAYNDIISRPGWDKISAVKNHRTYVFARPYLYGGGYVAQLAIIAKLLYPSVFKDVDPQQWIYDWLRDMGLESPEEVCKLPWVYPGFSAG